MTDSERPVGGAPRTAQGAADRVRRVVRMLLELHDLDLSAIIGKSRATAYTRHSGRTAFEVDEVAALADHFDVSVEVFFAGPQAVLRLLGSGDATLRKLSPALSTAGPAPVTGTRGRAAARKQRGTTHYQHPAIPQVAA